MELYSGFDISWRKVIYGIVFVFFLLKSEVTLVHVPQKDQKYLTFYL